MWKMWGQSKVPEWRTLALYSDPESAESDLTPKLSKKEGAPGCAFLIPP